MSEIDLIKKECADMVETLKALHKEESSLRKENKVLAQQAILAGGRGELEKRGRNKTKPSSVSTKKVESSAKSLTEA